MTKARILADYVAGGTTAAEFDVLDGLTSTTAELNYVDGVTSNVQTQMDAKLPLAGGTMTGDLVPTTPLSHRNVIINGGMQIWQRATAATAASGYDTVDRWKMNENSDGAMTSQKHTMSLADLNTTGHATALQLDVTTADSSIAASQYVYFLQNIEAQNLQHLQYGTANAQTITLSFWVKSNKTGVYNTHIYKSDTTTYNSFREYTISSANTWEKKTITITPTAGSTTLITNSGGVINNDTGVGIQVGFGLAWGSNFHGTNDTWTASNLYATSNQVNWMDSTSNNFYITGIQLELGSSATPFEHRSYADELVRCERYYQQIESKTMWGSGFARIRAAGKAQTMLRFHTTMRQTPDVLTFPTVGQSPGQITFLNGEGYPSTHGTIDETWATKDQVGCSGSGFSGFGDNNETVWAYAVGEPVFKFQSEL